MYHIILKDETLVLIKATNTATTTASTKITTTTIPIVTPATELQAQNINCT